MALFDAPRPPGRWLLLGGLFALYFAFGVIVTSIAPMLTLVQDDLGASRGEMGLVLGAWAFMFIGTAPLAGRFIDRFGLSHSLVIGGASIMASALARAAATDVTTLWLAVAVFGLGGPLISAGAPTLVRSWFTDQGERRRAVSAYAVAPGLGGVVALGLTNSVLLPVFGSWRAALGAEAVVGAAATLVWFVIARRVGPMPLAATAPPVAAPAVEQAGMGSPRRLLGSAGVRSVLLLAFPIFFLNHALNNWMPTVLAEVGDLSASVASNWVAVSRMVGMGAAIVVPNLVPSSRRFMALAVVCAALSLALLTMVTAPSLVVVAMLAIGVRGALTPIGTLLLMEAPGVSTRNAGLANGLWFSVGEVGGVMGPFVVGLVADSTLGFDGVVVALAVLALVTGVLALGVSPLPQRAAANS